MTVVGPNACALGNSYADGGTTAWATPTNIYTDDTNYATANMPGDTLSRMLRAQQFGFAIPGGAVITNVSFGLKYKCTSFNQVDELKFYMLGADGLPAGNNKANTSTHWPYNTDGLKTLSGDATYWGLTLTPALINDNDFGIGIATRNRDATSNTAYVNYVSCTVTYEVSGGIGLVGSGLCGHRFGRLVA